MTNKEREFSSIAEYLDQPLKSLKIVVERAEETTSQVLDELIKHGVHSPEEKPILMSACMTAIHELFITEKISFTRRIK